MDKQKDVGWVLYPTVRFVGSQARGLQDRRMQENLSTYDVTIPTSVVRSGVVLTHATLAS